MRRRATSVCERGSPISRRSTTEVSSPMATGPSPGDAPTDVARPMRFPLGVPAKRTDPGPVGSRRLQDPDGFLPDAPAFHGDLRPGSEAELLAEGGREGGLALGGDGHDVHAESVSRIALLGNVSGKALHKRRHSGSERNDSSTTRR